MFGVDVGFVVELGVGLGEGARWSEVVKLVEEMVVLGPGLGGKMAIATPG
jgi:hypothetical protein